MALRILILGGGGREHALVWKLHQSSLVGHIFVYPGNGGTELSSKTSNVNLPDPSFGNLTKWAVANDVSVASPIASGVLKKLRSKVNLVIPGPEQPLVDGVEYYFRKGAFHASYPPVHLSRLSSGIYAARMRQSESPCLAQVRSPHGWRGPRPSPRLS